MTLRKGRPDAIDRSLRFESLESRRLLAGTFQDTVALSGLTRPTVVRFSPDDRIFVAEKSGVIKVFDDLSDTTPTTFADLSTNVHNFWDRGLLGMDLHPDFPNTPYVYVLYAHDAPIGGTAPLWGTAGIHSDPCPNPPGATGDGCVVSGRLSRLEADGDVWVGPEEVLIEDWGQQYPSHSVGTIAFGPDGALYASGGDGASFNFVDYGQAGDPTNPLGDPPVGVGGTPTPPTAEGGALRSQDLRTAGDPVTLDGSIIRVDDLGAPLPNNPLIANADTNAQRIIAYGLRNPFRFAIRPGTNEIWSGDVGWGTWEEINRVTNPTDSVVENFGWPAYEGDNRQPGYDGANLDLIEDLYDEPAAHTPPYYAYDHAEQVDPGSGEPTGSSSIAGLAFHEGIGNYPAAYHDALFFADYSRDHIWLMYAGANGLPDPSTRESFIGEVNNPVYIGFGPDGDLYYADFNGGAIRRIRYFEDNEPPTALAQANPTNGQVPLLVNFDGTGSTDPNTGDVLTYEWDLDGDGQLDDSTDPQPTYLYNAPGTFTAQLRVTDSEGESDTDTIVINVSNTPPVPVIDTPAASLQWQVGQPINFSGHANDDEEGLLPPSALSWSVIIHHCPSNCHTHPFVDFSNVASGQFVAPDHEFPSHLELQLTATDSFGAQATASRLLFPQTVDLTFDSNPAGLQLVVNGANSTTPFSSTVMVGSNNSISAVSPQQIGGTTYQFVSWSDGGAQSHNITAPTATTTYTAQFAPIASGSPFLATGAIAGVSSSTWTPVTLGHNFQNMVVVTAPVYQNDSPPLVPRIRNASGNSFEVKLDRADGQSGTITADLQYLAAEEGVYTQEEHGVDFEAVRMNSTVTDHKVSWVGEQRNYFNSYANPVVLGQVMSYNDSDFSQFWSRGQTRSDIPSSSDFYVGKHVAEDSDTTRAAETIGYVVFEAGTGIVGDLRYVAAVGSDTVFGITNSPPFNYSINGLASVDTVVVSQTAMDGNNGGWAVIYGDDAISNSQLGLAIDEDTIRDSERQHTTEQVAYIAFEQLDVPSVGFAVNQSSGEESASPAQLEVVLTSASNNTVTVAYSANGGSAAGGGVDYSLTNNVVTFAPGETSQFIPIDIVDDLEEEADETIDITLSNPTNATLGSAPTHSYTILANDPTSNDILAVDFDQGTDGFSYVDDPFRSTGAPSYASGGHDPTGGFTGGGLTVLLGGQNNADIFGLSGGWRETFNLSTPTDVHISFRYNLTQASDYELDELSQALVTIDGVAYGSDTDDYLAEIVGNGNGGSAQSTGWQLVDLHVGTLGPGNHTLTIGGYNNKKTWNNETTEVRIDDVVVRESNVGQVFQQDTGTDGIVSIEATNFANNYARGNHDWEQIADGDATNNTAMQTAPNTSSNNNTGFVVNSPRLDYKVNFVKTGTHYVWVLGAAPPSTGSNDSIHIGLDNAANTTADRISNFSSSYEWSNDTMDGTRATIDVPSPGQHSLHAWMREDGFIFDKLVITSNPGWSPSGDGPPESATTNQQGSESDTTSGDTDVRDVDGIGRWLAYLAERGAWLRRFDRLFAALDRVADPDHDPSTHTHDSHDHEHSAHQHRDVAARVRAAVFEKLVSEIDETDVAELLLERAFTRDTQPRPEISSRVVDLVLARFD